MPPIEAPPERAASEIANVNIPLCVDLDGTLVRTDMLHESVLTLMKRNFWMSLCIPVWFCRGKAYLKRQLAIHAPVNPEFLPYDRDFLSYLDSRAKLGTRLVLATAADQLVAEKIAEHVGMFSQVLGSDGHSNYKGQSKGDLLVRFFGERKFDYAGDSTADLPVWSAARLAVLVGVTPALDRKMKSTGQSIAWQSLKKSAGLKTVLRSIRIHQWMKNLLVFMPLLLAHQFRAPLKLAHTLAGFVAFGLAASAVYVLNDLLDLQSDREHPTKRNRPFASGQLPLSLGFFLVPALLAGAAAICLFQPPTFGLVLAAYCLLAGLYSIRLKSIELVDVVVLACLYTVRIIAGGAVAQVPLSPWLLGFSAFFFGSLALVKRVSELRQLSELNRTASIGRGYLTADLSHLSTMGISAGYMSVLVVMLYANSPEVVKLYRHPQYIWLICLVVVYWLSRIWLIALRGQLHEDPVLYAIRDRVSYALAASVVALGVAAL